MCVCVREEEKERECVREREREDVCVCVRERGCVYVGTGVTGGNAHKLCHCQ